MLTGEAQTVLTIQPAVSPSLDSLPPLTVAFPSRSSGCALNILHQPEEQHRARYMTEGSRGAVKDKSGNSYPTVQVCSMHQTVTIGLVVCCG